MKKVFMFSIILVLGVFLYGFGMAETTDGDITSLDNLMPGTVEGTGIHFEVTDSEYLNIVLDSSETITLRLESVPEMVTMHIESASDVTSTQITISGFQPLTTYYKYEDDYHNEETFTTDGNGSYSWAQDLSQTHLVFIQPRKSTKFISDNSTGGDCYLIGTWDSATKTCTLTTDVYETIQIDSSLTLDGNGHTITGTGTGTGLYLRLRTDVTIKNLNVKNFEHGVLLYLSSNNTLTGNTFSNNRTGIELWWSNNNTFTNNIAQENSFSDVYILFGPRGIRDSYCNNNFQNTTGSGGRPIKYFNTSVNLDNEILSELILCNADYSNISNVTIKGSETLNNNTFFVINTDYSNITNTTSTNNNTGICLVNSDNNTLTGNTTSNNSSIGIMLYYSTNNTLTGNTISNNNGYGIELWVGNNNTLTGNTISNHLWMGIWFAASNNNLTYNNMFIDNSLQVTTNISRGNIFDLEKPIGGNCWSDFNTPDEGCNDTDYDGFCDTPYYIYSPDPGYADGVDYLPLASKDCEADTAPPTTSATLSGDSGNNDWYVSDVQITLTAVDNADGSGVKEIHYSINGGSETVVSGSSVSLTISTDGTYTLGYYAVDNANNNESQHNLTINIDKTPPVVTISGISDGATYSIGMETDASYSATDATSGIATSNDSLTGGDGFGLGTFTYSVTATDNAGNVATQIATYTVIATMDGLIELIRQFLNSGDIDNAGIANSLISKLENALNAKNGGNEQASDNIMQAFINQVEAQSGQHISEYAAAILINAAMYIINN